MNKLVIILIVLALLAGGFQVVKFINSEPELQTGGFQTVGGVTYYLYGSGVGTSDTSVTLTKFRIPGNDNYKLSMTDFGDTGYLTLEPGNLTRQEFVSFTGVTQNADGTATLTGVTRGLSPVSPYTASSTLQKAHSGGSIAVISNPPQLYEQLATLSNSELITGLWQFNTVLPRSSLVATTSTQFTTKTYVDSVANQGAATSTETNGGIVELATQLEMASSTDNGANQPTVIQSKYGTSTPSGTSASGLYAAITKNNGKLHQLFWDLSEAFTWTGLHTFSATSTFNSGVDIDADGDSPLVLNGVSYKFPAAITASSTIPITNGSGSIYWTYPGGLVTSLMPEPAFLATTTQNNVTIFNGNTTARVHAFSLAHSIVVNRIGIELSTVTSPSTMDFAVYKSNGDKVFEVTSGTSMANALSTTTVNAVTLVPGTYYFAAVANGASADISGPTYISNPLYLTGHTGEDKLGGTLTVSAGTLPSSLTISNISSAVQAGLPFRLDN